MRLKIMWVYRIHDPHGQNYPRILFEKSRGQNFLDVVHSSAIDGSILPQENLEDQPVSLNVPNCLIIKKKYI